MFNRKILGVLALVTTALVVAACGSSSSGGGAGSKGPLTFATFNPYSGPDASFGPELGAGCYPAAKVVEQAGGVLGHTKINCIAVDSRGDPADAVPAAAQMIASTSNLEGILGPSSDEAAATVPRINDAHIPMFADTGQTLFNKNKYPYFWRITAPDSAAGYIEARWAHDAGYKRAALIYGNDISAQGTVPTITQGFQELGGTIAIRLTMALDQSDYRSEVERVIAAKPDVIFTEVDPQTAATFFGELKQLQGTVQPLDGSAAQYKPWIKAVGKAIGMNLLAKDLHTSLNTGELSGPAWQQFSSNLLTSKQVSDPKQWIQDIYSETGFDAVIIYNLAMLAAHSTSPTVWSSFIPKVTTAGNGATVVNTFAQGKADLAKGMKIDYVGATGPIAFDQYHNSAGGWEILGLKPSGQLYIVARYSAGAVTALEK